MSKYSRELKFKVAKKYLDGSTPRELAEKYSVPTIHVRYWAHVFTMHGSNSFLIDGHSLSAEAKLEALQLLWTKGWSVRHTSAVLNLSFPTTLTSWLRKYEKQGIIGLEKHKRAIIPM
ncbi:MAG: helix-turn-helix domain-containing protein, partial [Vibrio sp.]|uniref:helix-turn-helix domain-containing protein n=1 Tax=Vibrio sp. TaxID=678 RepID=UPI003A889C1A